MNDVELVAAALAAGATGGLTEAARTGVHDLYAGLRDAVRRRLARDGGGADGVQVLEAPGADPEAWRRRLVDVLVGSGAVEDPWILDTARALLVAAHHAGGITVHAPDAKGLQIGDRNVQHNTFN